MWFIRITTDRNAETYRLVYKEISERCVASDEAIWPVIPELGHAHFSLAESFCAAIIRPRRVGTSPTPTHSDSKLGGKPMANCKVESGECKIKDISFLDDC